MAEQKTKPTKVSLDSFLEGVTGEDMTVVRGLEAVAAAEAELRVGKRSPINDMEPRRG